MVQLATINDVLVPGRVVTPSAKNNGVGRCDRQRARSNSSRTPPHIPHI